jgi:hypothetical protein
MPRCALRITVLVSCVFAVLAGCERSPPPFQKTDGGWRYRNLPIADADVATFEVLSEHYAKDRARVYYGDTYRDGREYYAIAHPRVITIAGADPASFRYLDRDHAKDARHVYFEGKRTEVEDAATFELLDYAFARDRVSGYCHLSAIPGSEGGTFAGLDAHYAKDRARAWHCSIETDGGARAPYVRLVRVANADLATFRPLEQGYAMDARTVYYGGVALRDADVATFAILSAPTDGADARDARGAYARGARLVPPP